MRESNPLRGLDFLQSGTENLRATITPISQTCTGKRNRTSTEGLEAPVQRRTLVC